MYETDDLNQYVCVVEEEGDSPLELPLEPDGTLLLSSLNAQFPRATGLKFKPHGSENFRGTRLSDGKLYPPSDGWFSYSLFQCVFPKSKTDNKRKYDDAEENSNPKMKKPTSRKCCDLIVLNLAWKTDEKDLQEYFSKFGELVAIQIKRDPDSKNSRGFGFIRFAEYDAQFNCLSQFKHNINNRWVEVKVPLSKNEADRQETSRKIHVSKITEDMSSDEIRQFFTKFGEVQQVFLPKPFRSFAFVTFEDPIVAEGLLGRELMIKNQKVTIGTAAPRLPQQGEHKLAAKMQQQGMNMMFPGNQSSHNMLNNFQYDSMASSSNGGGWGQRSYKPEYNDMGYRGNNSNNSRIPFPGNPYNQMPQNNQMMMRGDYPQQQDPLNQSTNAMAALNILNNPGVVNAIMNAVAQHGNSGKMDGK